VWISIDDFGTGYSSLSYLKAFPIDTLKIDKSFVRDIDTNAADAAIAATVIAIARTLRLRLVAEGVERPEHSPGGTAIGPRGTSSGDPCRPRIFRRFWERTGAGTHKLPCPPILGPNRRPRSVRRSRLPDRPRPHLFTDLTAAELMTPRTEIEALPVTLTWRRPRAVTRQICSAMSKVAA